jgi:hypothetical protein
VHHNSFTSSPEHPSSDDFRLKYCMDVRWRCSCNEVKTGASSFTSPCTLGRRGGVRHSLQFPRSCSNHDNHDKGCFVSPLGILQGVSSIRPSPENQSFVKFLLSLYQLQLMLTINFRTRGFFASFHPVVVCPLTLADIIHVPRLTGGISISSLCISSSGCELHRL